MKEPLLDLHLCKGLGDTICSTPIWNDDFIPYYQEIMIYIDNRD